MAVRSAFALLCFALLCGLVAASSGKLQSETETELRTKNEGEAAGNQLLVAEAVESRVARGSKDGKRKKKTGACEKNPKSKKCERQNARKNRQNKRKQVKRTGKGKNKGK